ncbi:hypothetical protein BTVI_92803 [Pitangus sulphuratus]|nr:hypothetical protein BTVI_92803 [Pitangus sulphuratus]
MGRLDHQSSLGSHDLVYVGEMADTEYWTKELFLELGSCVLAAQKANHILACITSGASRIREMILPLQSTPGYELHGVENLPEGPGILVYYHGAIPIDYLYFLSRLFLWKKRLCLSVADHFVFRLPGLKLLLAVTGVIPGTREECLLALKNGYLVSISPGGVREALFSDESYQLVWGNRKGFAQVALDAKVPIIPMYTQNVREGYRMFKERRFFRKLYESTRLPFTPPYGGLPVKFRTYIGKPIPYDPNITTEELVEKHNNIIMESVQRRAAKLVKGLEHSSYEEHLKKVLEFSSGNRNEKELSLDLPHSHSPFLSSSFTPPNKVHEISEVHVTNAMYLSTAEDKSTAGHIVMLRSKEADEEQNVEMTGGNESCIAGPIPMSYLTCLTYILQEWTGVEHIGDYLSYAFYLVWVLFPLAVVFILPGVIVALFYISILVLHIYKRKNELKEAYSHDVWIGAREMLATLWDGHGRIWHGYELHGIKNIPEGPGLVVFYHGATPVDYIYFMARLHVTTKRSCRVVADHFVFRLPGQTWSKDDILAIFLPGFKILLDVHGVIPGPREACVSTLKEGHLLAIAPGGVREALFSDEMYTILWSDRKGFAQVAIDAKVPIIPMFTQNVREGFRTLGGINTLRRKDSTPS